MSTKPNLADVLAEAGGSTRRRSAVPVPVAVREAVDDATVYQQPGRVGTKPITGHFPVEVRNQLKMLAIEQGTTLQNLLAEAFNDLFAKHGKPEIVPASEGDP